jgi:hypothetical protein
MNKEEMDEFLISIGGLERTHREDKGPIVDAGYFGVGEGWYPIIKNIINELIALGWDKRAVQVKEKFGGLRFYLESYPEGADDVIIKYEKLSYETCETCGEKGSNSKIKGWLYTLCDDHAKEKEDENR